MADGPLRRVRVVELAGIGPGPFACMLLADLGADVVRVARPGGADGLAPGRDPLLRGRPTLAADLKDPADRERVRALIDRADVLVEGFRPGVAERLGVGPAEFATRNPRLVYARMTGWGQEGPLAARAGHDINYAGLTGALHAIGEAGGPPVPPLNLVADFGGGALYCVMGVLAALIERTGSGLGQLVDAAMVDGASSLMAMTYGFLAAGLWRDERGGNLLDGGAPFYATYLCADDRYVAVGALEPQFFATLQQTLGIRLPEQYDRSQWPMMRAQLTAAFAVAPREHWARRFAAVDACVSPVLSLREAPLGEHLAARGSFVDRAGVMQPSAAPRLSRTPGATGAAGTAPGPLPKATIARWGLPPAMFNA